MPGKTDPADLRLTAYAVAGFAFIALLGPLTYWASTDFALPALPELPDWPPLAWGLLAAWIAIGLLTAWLASQRGRSPLAWLAMGLLLGPFALLAVGLAPVRESGR